MGKYDYSRRKTNTVKAGKTYIGGENRIRIQSMTNTSTMDTVGSVNQAIRMAATGAELIRLTAQGEREAKNIGEIRELLRSKGIETPLVADIHFNPKAAYASIGNADKIRINPGNFVDPGRTFRKLEYSDEEYASELKRLEDAVLPFLKECEASGTAIRIGVNHGSLSDRIMSRYGDTPEGMVESALEFLRICRKHGFENVVVSIKASNVKVMVSTVRLLVDKMEEEGMAYPLHLGVTEAGDGEDGRIKSAVGIGTLLLDGIGDTIRVSLSEAPEAELPVAKKIVDYIGEIDGSPSIETGESVESDATNSETTKGRCIPIVVGEKREKTEGTDRVPDLASEDVKAYRHIETPLKKGVVDEINDDETIVLYTRHPNYRGAMRSSIDTMRAAGKNNPVILQANYNGMTPEDAILRASMELGSLLLDGYGDGIQIISDSLSDREIVDLSFKILQAVRLRITETEYIACPGCGRTLFDLQKTLSEVKRVTKGLKGLKIGVMGCIVNGPGEMADADYGYVGAGIGKVSLYKGKECVEKNIPEEEAVEKLLALIKKDQG